MTFKDYLIRVFTWWNGTTFGTQFYTWRRGQFVGDDELGNKYYRAIGHVIDPSVGAERRWVIYNGRSRSLESAARLARLADPHLRRPAERGRLCAAHMGEAWASPT